MDSQLLKPGGESTLLVGEVQGHCFTYMPHVRKALEAHQLSVNFFRKHVR